MGSNYRSQYRQFPHLQQQQRVSTVSLDVPPTEVVVMPRITEKMTKTNSKGHPNQDEGKLDASASGRRFLDRLDSVDTAFRPHRIILQLLGRFPFSPASTASYSNSKIHAAGIKVQKIAPLPASFEHKHSIWTLHWAYFLMTSAFIGFVLVMCTLGFVNVFLGWGWGIGAGTNESKSLSAEEHKIRDNLVAFVLFWSCLFHINVTNLFLYRSRRRIVNYLKQWNTVIAATGIGVPSAITRFIIFSNLWYFVFLLVVVGSYAFNFHKIARGGAVMVSTLVLSPFVAVAEGPTDFGSAYYLFGLFTLLYCIYASRSVLIIYLFKLRLLRHAFKVWNGRLEEQLQLQVSDGDDVGKLAPVGSYEEQVACEKLYSDHVTLVTLVKETDRVFGRILQAYYASQIPNMCFELYFLARFGNISNQSGSGLLSYSTVDRSDILAAIVLLGQTLLLFLTVSLDASHVSEEAMKGFELLRARGIRVTDSVPKKYLFYSLEMSYSQRIVLTGGKYFAIDRPFIITVLGAVFTYFIIILQFGIGTFGGGGSGTAVVTAWNLTQARTGGKI